MRAVGEGIIRLESEKANHLTSVGKLYCGDQFSVSGGNYALSFQISAISKLTINFENLSGAKGGVHEQFWAQFNKFLSRLSEAVLAASEVDALAVSGRIIELQTILSSSGNSSGTWLSVIRNKINYQHQYGVWFPFSGEDAKFSKEKMASLKSNSSMRLDFRTDTQPLDAFNAACSFISAINHDLCESLVTLANDKKCSFIKNWSRLVHEAG